MHFSNERQVNISGECRERILATDVTAYDIFDEARTEVLAVMEVRMLCGFIRTTALQWSPGCGCVCIVMHDGVHPNECLRVLLLWQADVQALMP